MGQRFEDKTDRSSIANAFSQSLRVRQDTDGAQCLWIAFQQNALTCIGAKRRGNNFFAQPELNEIQVGVYLSDLEALTLIFAQMIAKGFEDPVVDNIIRGLRSMTVFDLVDAIRFQSGDLTGGQCAREIKCRFSNTATYRTCR